MEIKIIESKAKPNKAFKLSLRADGPDDMEFLTALSAALIHKRQVIVCTTDDPKGIRLTFVPALTYDGR